MPSTIPKSFGNYQVLSVINVGEFASLYKCYNTKINQFFTCKVVEREELVKRGDLQKFERELRIHERMQHPNIVQVQEILYLKDYIVIVMEYLPNGDLFAHIDHRTLFTERQMLDIAFQILRALSYLHSRGITHRDIKPENIVFDDNMVPKLVDFGLCRDTTNLMSTKCGTIFYSAPEVIQSGRYDGEHCDIWSFGVTMYALATGCLPWDEPNPIRFMQRILKNDINMKIDLKGPLYLLVSRCLQVSPKMRPTADELLKSDIFKNYQKSDLSKALNVANYTLLSKSVHNATIRPKRTRLTVRTNTELKTFAPINPLLMIRSCQF